MLLSTLKGPGRCCGSLLTRFAFSLCSYSIFRAEVALCRMYVSLPPACIPQVKLRKGQIHHHCIFPQSDAPVSVYSFPDFGFFRIFIFLIFFNGLALPSPSTLSPDTKQHIIRKIDLSCMTRNVIAKAMPKQPESHTARLRGYVVPMHVKAG